MGHSLIPYLYDGYRDPHRLIYSSEASGAKRKEHQRSVTGLRWKMIRWLDENKEFLYDLKKDPKEKRNVISKHPKVAKKLRKELNRVLEREAIDTIPLE